MKEKLLADIDRQIARHRTAIDKFVAELPQNPFYVLSWSDNINERVAEFAVLTDVRNELTRSSEEVNVQSLIDMLREQVDNAVRHPPRSTSPMSNLMALNANAARVRTMDFLRSYLDDID